MHESHGWLLDAQLMKIAIAIWVSVVVAYGFWRSRGSAPQDAIRSSGPIF